MACLISIDRIRSEEAIYINETFSPDFLDITDQDISFSSPVEADIKLFLEGDFLLLNCTLQTECQYRCKICNEPFPLPLSICFQWVSEELHTAEFDLLPILREHILLELPFFAECNQGSCPERAVLQQFLAKDKSPFSVLAELEKGID